MANLANESFDLHIHAFTAGEAQTIAGIQQMFGVDAAQAKSVYAAVPITLKRGLTRDEAKQFATALEHIGAQVSVTPAAGSQAAVPAPSAADDFLDDVSRELDALEAPPAADLENIALLDEREPEPAALFSEDFMPGFGAGPAALPALAAPEPDLVHASTLAVKASEQAAPVAPSLPALIESAPPPALGGMDSIPPALGGGDSIPPALGGGDSIPPAARATTFLDRLVRFLDGAQHFSTHPIDWTHAWAETTVDELRPRRGLRRELSGGERFAREVALFLLWLYGVLGPAFGWLGATLKRGERGEPAAGGTDGGDRGPK